jgi:hypothetical protein
MKLRYSKWLIIFQLDLIEVEMQLEDFEITIDGICFQN